MLPLTAFIFSNTFSNSASEGNNSQTTTNSIPVLMTKTKLSEYLQISEQSMKIVIKNDDVEKATLSSRDTRGRLFIHCTSSEARRFYIIILAIYNGIKRVTS